jgi:ribosomal protein S18 acetylase RimI-like enzyme
MDTPDVGGLSGAIPTLRSAGMDDIDDVLDLWQQSDAEPTHTDDHDSVRRLIIYQPGALIVADTGQQLVGSVIAGWDGWRGSIYRLVVAPAHRRTGLGRRLVAEAERRLSAMGAVRLQAIVVETDARAAGFWQNSGWEQQTARLRFVRG